MKKCLVIGGGIAGLTAAAILSSKKIHVTVLESSPKLGGRTYSYFDEKRTTVIDNGQHILMGCYKQTLSFLKLIGAEKNFLFQKRLHIDFIDINKNILSLSAKSLFYPFNLVLAIFNYNVLSLNDKLKFIGFILKIPFYSKKTLIKYSVTQWLEQENQSNELIQYFWAVLCIGAMNTNLEKASALVFHKILMKIFFSGNLASTIVLPKFGLSESIIFPAEKFIVENGGEVIKSTSVKQLIIDNNMITRIITSDGNLDDFDIVISAIPQYVLNDLIEINRVSNKPTLNYSTILNIHLWLSENDLTKNFYGLLNSPLHWIFIKEKHINIVISDADYLRDKNQNELFDLVTKELTKFTSISRDKIIDFKIIKEKRATFVPDNDSNYSRPDTRTEINNLFLAGDWINTGLPATIESAAVSGSTAAELVYSEIIGELKR